MKKLIPFLLLILIIVVVYGIFNSIGSAQSYSSILSDSSCAPPCWNQIKPGETLMWDAVSSLENMENPYSILADETEYGYDVNWEFYYPIRETGGNIYCIENTVMAISIMTGDTIKVADAFEKYGEPDFSWAHFRKPYDRSLLNVFLVYPTKGVIVQVDLVFNDAESVSAEMDKDSLVGKVIYFDPDQYMQLLDSQILFRETREQIQEGIQLWQGLGVISSDELVLE